MNKGFLRSLCLPIRFSFFEPLTAPPFKLQLNGTYPARWAFPDTRLAVYGVVCFAKADPIANLYI
jgi:hypothetical protein